MKKICTILAAMLATSVLAQDNTNQLPEMPAPVTSPAAETTPAPGEPATVETPAPATTPAPAPGAVPEKSETPKPKKHVAPRKPINEPTVTLVPGPAEVTANNLLVRGEPGFRGTAITHLSKGTAVDVMDQINLSKHRTGEPAQWAKIALPTNVDVWISARYVDASSAVTARKLNVRAGPGENFGVVGVLEHGATVTQEGTRGSWMKIAPPSGTYAFVAAMYLKQEAPAVAAATPPPAPMEEEPAPTPTPVPEAPQQTMPEAATPEQTLLEANTPPPTRVAVHEGVVRHVLSPITPTAYELYDPTTDNNIDFLYSTSTNLDLGRYTNMRIIVTGEEGLAQRWHAIPVMTVQSIVVVQTNAVPQKIYRSPRLQQEMGH